MQINTKTKFTTIKEVVIIMSIRIMLIITTMILMKLKLKIIL